LSLLPGTLTKSPDLLADPTSSLGWGASLVFWTNPDFNCAGAWGSLAGKPNCQSAAAAGNLAVTTSRINPRECVGGDLTARQPFRVSNVQWVRQQWGLPQLTENTTC
jgi:hypothetical protein